MRNERGQSTLEFALSLVLVMLLTIFFVRLSLVFGVASYIQYATFMAARSFMVSADTTQEQVARGRRVLAVTVAGGPGREGDERWEGLLRGVPEGEARPRGARIGAGEQFQPNDKAYSWQEGVRYKFRSPIFAIPVFSSGDDSRVTLQSESWLGREPTTDECEDYLRDITGNNLVLDNGC